MPRDRGDVETKRSAASAPALTQQQRRCHLQSPAPCGRCPWPGAHGEASLGRCSGTFIQRGQWNAIKPFITPYNDLRAASPHQLLAPLYPPQKHTALLCVMLRGNTGDRRGGGVAWGPPPSGSCLPCLAPPEQTSETSACSPALSGLRPLPQAQAPPHSAGQARRPSSVCPLSDYHTLHGSLE